MERDVTFELHSGQTRFQGSKIPLFGPLGIEIEWKPTFHVSDFQKAENK